MKLFGNKKNSAGRKTRSTGATERPVPDLRVKPPEPDGTEKRKPVSRTAKSGARTAKSAKSGGAKKVLRTILTAILLIAVGLIAYYVVFVKPPEVEMGIDPPTSATPGTTDQDPNGENPDPTPEIGDTNRRQGTYTFLLVGDDAVEANTDTIMVGMLDVNKGEVNIVSIPRDILVNVPWKIKKVNSLLYQSGTANIADLKAGIGDLLGFTVDNYAIVDVKAFVELVDAIGGVDYDVPVNMKYFDLDQDLYIDIAKGPQHLNGTEALKVVRFRSGYIDQDIGRIRTQQDFLITVAKQLLQVKNVFKITEVSRIIKENVETDLTVNNIIWFIEQFFSIDTDNIHFHTAPGAYDLELPGGNFGGSPLAGGWYASLDLEAWIDLVNECLNPFNTPVSPERLDVLTYEDGAFHSTSGVLK